MTCLFFGICFWKLSSGSFSFEMVLQLSKLNLNGHEVWDVVNDTMARLVAWSLDHAARGVFPTRGFHGEAFDRRSYRASLAGKRICFESGFKLLVVLPVTIFLL